MKFKFLLLTLVITLLSLSSCVQEHPNQQDIQKEVKVNATIRNKVDGATVTTRAINNEWSNDDSIGVFMKTAGLGLSMNNLAHNVKYITDGTGGFINATNNKIYFPFNNEEVDFIAYYPYNSALSGLIYEIDVSNQTYLEALDFMYSNNVKNVNSLNETIDLNFVRQLTKLTLNIKHKDTGEKIKNATAKITNVNTKASFSLVEGRITTIESDPKSVELKTNPTNARSEAILLPDDDLTNKSLIISIDGVDYEFSLDCSDVINSFDKAKNCEYNISIVPGQGPVLSNVTATVTDWVTVIDNVEANEVPSDSTVKPEGDGEDQTLPEGGGDDNEPPIEEETSTENAGDGTFENPYSIAEAKLLDEGKGIWVKGYIVGYYERVTTSNIENFIKGSAGAHKSNLALAFTKDEDEYQKTFPIHFKNCTITETFIDNINLETNSDNLGKEVSLKGDLEWFFSVDEDLALKKISAAVFEKKLYERFSVSEL